MHIEEYRGESLVVYTVQSKKKEQKIKYKMANTYGMASPMCSSRQEKKENQGKQNCYSQRKARRLKGFEY